MSGAAAYREDDFEERQAYEAELHEAKTCDWCGGNLPEWAYTFCSALCAANSRLDAMGDGA